MWDRNDADYDYKACECGWVDKSQSFDKTVSRINQKLLLTGNCTINIDGVSEYDSVESIKFGEYDLGSDLSLLRISDALKADVTNHGKQTVIITVTDSDGAVHEIHVPVTFITAEISSAEEFKKIQPSSAQKGIYGYYVLTNDISDNSLASSAYADDWEETTGFFATLDGQGHTISAAANGGKGIFGILRGATIKNLTIRDNYRSAYQNYALLAKASFNSTIENVTFTYVAGKTNSNLGDGYGWLSCAAFENNTLINVTVNDTQGYGSLFGYKFTGNVFINVVIQGEFIEMGHTAEGESISYDAVTKGKQVTLAGRQDFILDGKDVSVIDIGEYGDAEILSITTSTGYELYTLSSDSVDDVFKTAKHAHGEQNLIVKISRGGEIIVVTVPVTVITKVIYTMADLQTYVKHKATDTDDINGYYVLGNNVTYTETGFTAVTASGGWSSSKAFKGTFDGRGFTITTNSSGAMYGLFGTLNGATIKNVTVTDVWSGGAVIARNAYNTTFDNVKIVISNGNVLSGAADNTPIIGNTMQKCTLANVDITSSKDIVYVFATQNENVFTDVTITANVTGGFAESSPEYPTGVELKSN